MTNEELGCAQAQIDWDENGLPHSRQFNDIYFSKADAIAESRYVFLQGNQLPELWESDYEKNCFTIAETGFGTGLNFLLTWQAWEAHLAKNFKAQNQQRLHFISVEKFPLTRKDLKTALNNWPELSNYAQELLLAYPPQPGSGMSKLQFTSGHITLTLIFDDALTGLAKLLPSLKQGPQVSSTVHALGESPNYIDAWYLDGFAPAKNPEMWKEDIFSLMARLSHTGTRFATFTAAGDVRRGLSKHGFDCKKLKGFGRKREMLTGEFNPPPTVSSLESQPSPSHFREYKQHAVATDDAWHIKKYHAKAVNTCLVIGGGISGCLTAHALAKKGLKVTLLEQHDALASEASGNRQGVVYGKMSLNPSPINCFNLAALFYANRFYHNNNIYRRCGDACGVIQLATNPTLHEQYLNFANQYAHEPEFVRFLEPSECKNVSGVSSQLPGLFFNNTGWLDPRKLCQQVLGHHNITHVANFRVNVLEKMPTGWCAKGENNHDTFHADIAVVANAYDAIRFDQLSHLPVKTIRGQVSHVNATPTSAKLKCVLCAEGYFPPPYEGTHALGATFNLGENNTALNDDDHSENIEKLRALSQDFEADEFQLDQPAGKVGFRCTTPDYLPLVGPVADANAMLEQFGFLRKKANASIDATGCYHDGLYVNIGHGSRGLCYTPISAELIASLITGDFLPISNELYPYLHPARFIIRDLKRNKV